MILVIKKGMVVREVEIGEVQPQQQPYPYLLFYPYYHYYPYLYLNKAHQEHHY